MILSPKYCRDRGNWRCIINVKRIIPIDGELASGKSTQVRIISQWLKEEKGHPVLSIYSGSLYRAVAVLVRLFFVDSPEKLDDVSVADVVRLASQLRLELVDGRPAHDGVVIAEGFLKDPEVTALSSRIAVRKEIREYVNGLIWDAAQGFNGFVLVDGRDGGTVLFPEADLKVFLTVSDGEAARRQNSTVAAVQERNHRDRERSEAPMVIADGAVVLNTTDKFETDVFCLLKAEFQRIFPELA